MLKYLKELTAYFNERRGLKYIMLESEVVKDQKNADNRCFQISRELWHLGGFWGEGGSVKRMRYILI